MAPIRTRLLNRTARAARGFTLIELLVVVAILVILSGIVLQRMDVFQLKANKGVAAANMMDISRAVQQFYVQNTSYPNQWDSLVDGTGNLWLPGTPGTTPGLDPQLVGGPPAGSPHKLVTTKLGGTLELRSLARMGITTVEDLTASAVGSALPGNCFTTARPLTADATLATVNPADDDGKAIINHFYPQQADSSAPVVPAGHQIVVFGLGPLNTMMGTALQEVPFYTNTNSTQYYNRMLVCFETCTDGTRARLLGVVGGDADLPSDEIGDYYGR